MTCPFSVLLLMRLFIVHTHSEFSPLHQNASSKKLFLNLNLNWMNGYTEEKCKFNWTLLNWLSTVVLNKKMIDISLETASPHFSKIFPVFLNLSRQILYSCFSLSIVGSIYESTSRFVLNFSLCFDQDLRLMSWHHYFDFAWSALCHRESKASLMSTQNAFEAHQGKKNKGGAFILKENYCCCCLEQNFWFLSFFSRK
jgi:hypothetical protein